MNKIGKAAVALLVTGALALTACGSDNGDTGGGGEGFDSLTIMAPYFSTTPPEADNPVQVALVPRFSTIGGQPTVLRAAQQPMTPGT